VIEDLPTTATMEVLDSIHQMNVRSNELVGQAQAFLMGEMRLDGVAITRLLRDLTAVAKSQSQMLVKLVETQLQLDDQLKAIVSGMEAGDEDT
jgi:hypothetical protein